MNIFDKLMETNSQNEIKFNTWVEWDHFNIPNKPSWLREILRNIMAVFHHCKTCTAIDGCYYVLSNMPEQPLHPNCDCTKINVSYTNFVARAKAECDIRKFKEYIFIDKNKRALFEKMGYTIDDSEYLQKEICNQALKNYLSGRYSLKSLSENGQMIAIPVRFNGFLFNSGWKLCPDGKIQNTTPFGGWTK